jgi:Tfp pilus assembly protein PilF
MSTEHKGPMDQFSAHLDRGWDLVARGDLAGAMVSAQKSLELDAESPEAHNLMGFIHASEGNADEALEHYRHAIDSDETFVEAMLNAAEVLLHPLGETEGAVDMIDEALDFCETPDEIADALLLKVEIFLHAGDLERATQVVREVPEGPFENPQLDLLVARARIEVGDMEGAEPQLRKALEHDPNVPDAHYYLGLVREAQGDLRGSTMAFLRARELDLQEPPAAWSLSSSAFEERLHNAVRSLPEDLATRLEGALFVTCDMPGAEVVADGVDPRVPLLLDEGPGDDAADPGRVSRVFVYQRNLERLAAEVTEVAEEITRHLERELRSLEAKDEPAAKPSRPGHGAGRPERR